MESMTTPKGTVLPILNLKGKPYLQVAHRIVWFREEHPDWSIITELVSRAPDHTLFKAVIYTPDCQTIATAHKLETKADFNDHMEKAETGAIGRALALCGYGTQFAEITEDDRIVDSPVQPAMRAAAEEMIAIAKEHYTEPRTVSIPGIAGEYEIHFGKHKGKKIKELAFADGESYFTFLSETSARENKPMNPGARDFCINWQKYRDSRKPSKIETIQEESINLEDLPF